MVDSLEIRSERLDREALYQDYFVKIVLLLISDCYNK